jgi:CRP-like cAMP-binding protein
MTNHQDEPRERNRFLAALDAADFEWLRPHLSPYELRVGKRLFYSGDEVEEVIFPHSGLVALTMPSPEESGALALMVGLDGVVGGSAAAADAPASCDAEVHIAGEGSRLLASFFRRALDEQPGIRRTAARFDNLMLAQALQTALCNASHPVEARICRWLLEIHDRISNDRVPVTQSTLAHARGSSHDGDARGRPARGSRRAELPTRLPADPEPGETRAACVRMLPTSAGPGQEAGSAHTHHVEPNDHSDLRPPLAKISSPVTARALRRVNTVDN